MKKMTEKELLLIANEKRESAYSPYSGVTVGAALLTKNGKVYTGANVENASYGATVCAERIAFFCAICDGEREFSAIAISGGNSKEKSKPAFMPCGICRQVMAEFCDEDFEIITDTEDGFKKTKLSELLPYSFGKGLL